MLSEHIYIGEHGDGIVFTGREDFAAIADFLDPSRLMYRPYDQGVDAVNRQCAKARKDFDEDLKRSGYATDAYIDFRNGIQAFLRLAFSDDNLVDFETMENYLLSDEVESEMRDFFNEADIDDCDQIVCELRLYDRDDDGNYHTLYLTAKNHGVPYADGQIDLDPLFKDRNDRQHPWPTDPNQKENA